MKSGRNGNGEACATSLGLFFGDGPITRQSEGDLAERGVDAFAMMRNDAHGKGFAGDEFAAVGNSIDADPGD